MTMCWSSPKTANVAWLSGQPRQAKTAEVILTERPFTITNMKGEDGGRVSSDQGALSIKLSNTPMYLAPVK
jgi:hypothetical protein